MNANEREARKRSPELFSKRPTQTRATFDTYGRAGDQAYRGFLIQHNAIHETWFVSKNRAHIASAATLTEAKGIIDMLTASSSNPKRRRSPAQRAATAKLVAMNKARRQGNPSAGRSRIAASAHDQNPAGKVTRGLGYAVLSGAHLHSLWRHRNDAIDAAKSLADSIGSPIRVAAVAYTWAIE